MRQGPLLGAFGGLGVLLAAGTLAAPPEAVEPPKRVNPHHAESDDRNSCSACHTKVPRPRVAPESAELRLEPLAACATCHPGMPHAGAAAHFGQDLPAGVELPSAAGKIACFTCHDVHGGVPAGDVASTRFARRLQDHTRLGRGAGITYAGEGEGRPPMLRRPLEGGALCRVCHGEGP